MSSKIQLLHPKPISLPSKDTRPANCSVKVPFEVQTISHKFKVRPGLRIGTTQIQYSKDLQKTKDIKPNPEAKSFRKPKGGREKEVRRTTERGKHKTKYINEVNQKS